MQVVRHVAHGSLKAGDVGELAGVSGNTIGQWARWGYIRASVSDGDPHVYAVEDVMEAATVQALRERSVTHAQIRRAIAGLGGDGGGAPPPGPPGPPPAPRPPGAP